ncbi:hypothetical protein ACLUTX_12425 [Enterobacterales bacterium AE_CKDN230030158-1A_HGKHYDSX7]
MEKLVRVIAVCSVASTILSGIAAYYAYEAWYSADDAYSAAEAASTYSQDAVSACQR